MSCLCSLKMSLTFTHTSIYSYLSLSRLMKRLDSCAVRCSASSLFIRCQHYSMRYQNWDVLLFPGDSRIPIQEFNTACHVITDQSK